MERKKTTLFIFILMAWCSIMPCFAYSDEDHIVDMKIDDANKVITVFMDDEYANQSFTEKTIRKKYKKVRKAMPKEVRDYIIRIVTRGTLIENLSEQKEEKKAETAHKKKKKKHGGWWGNVYYDGRPWVTNISRPHTLQSALNEKHISLWASHGRYYDVGKGRWKWQRPNMFCTTEDLFTQTIVVPYLIPMLENAGANVFTPRERDWQTEEVIVDNASPSPFYFESGNDGSWTTPHVRGFNIPYGVLTDGFNPFEQGTVRQINTTHSDDATTASYQPQLRKAGKYAVYVSYATVEKSCDEVLYSVYHRGQRTDFLVNQQMGGGTWVYLGTFDFAEGCSTENRVVVSSHSKKKGVVTTDAVRFGGGMGNIERGGELSGLPRCLEGARYYAQWAGLPYEKYGGYKGTDDYKDDINVRSLMTNWLAGGSPYAPNKEGKNVPIDLALAVHSDAGYSADMTSIYGSLAVCTTNANNGILDAGVSRSHSKDLCQMMLDNTRDDLSKRYGNWAWRDLYDRNYSETRLPAMPSMIFETLSHQNFPDMRLAHDPDFKFTIARSIYKTLLRFEAEAHGEKAIVSPLAPNNFHAVIDKNGNARLRWLPVEDVTESTAKPNSYNVYVAVGNGDYDNGTNINQTSCTVPVEQDRLYRFRVTAVNAGGESFPTEELCVLWHNPDAPTILVVNGFQRLSSPAVINTPTMKGFDIDEDPGVSYGLTAGWNGRQQSFNVSTAGHEGPGCFSYCGDEMAGHFVAGNDFNYVAEHAKAIMTAGTFNICSTTKSVVEWGGVDLRDYAVVDLLMGNERNDGHSLVRYKTFGPLLMDKIRKYALTGRGALLLSGSYVASDMYSSDEAQFMRDVFHVSQGGFTRTNNQTVRGMQQNVLLTQSLNADHYATTQSDILLPAGGFVAMQYMDNSTAAVAYQGPTPTFTMGFPLECISNETQRASIMRGVLAFLMQK